MSDHPEDSTDQHKLQSVEDAVDSGRSNYGTSVDYNVIMEALEAAGWVYRG